MVQTSSFVVLTAIALGAVSTVSAIPLYPGQSAPAPAPANPVRGSQRTGLKPQQQQQLERERPASLISNPGAQRVENAVRPQRLTGEQRVKGALKSQNERLENMEKTDLRLDTQRGTQLEAEAQAYEKEAKHLQSNLGAQQRLGMQKYRRTLTPKPAPPAVQNTPARPIANAARPAANAAGAPARPNNGRPSTPQQQLSSQQTTLQTTEKKFAAEDQKKFKEYQTEADAYRKQYNQLESQIKEAAKPAYVQGIDAQNAAIKGQQATVAGDRKLVQEDRKATMPGAPSTQRPGVAPRDLEDDIEFFGRDLEDDVEFFGRDFEDDVEEFAREWDEYDARAVAAEAPIEAAPAIPQEGVATPPADVSAAEQQLPLPPAPKKKHHSHHKKQRTQKKAMSLPRDLEDETEAFAREWEEFITREWAALEELD